MHAHHWPLSHSARSIAISLLVQRFDCFQLFHIFFLFANFATLPMTQFRSTRCDRDVMSRIVKPVITGFFRLPNLDGTTQPGVRPIAVVMMHLYTPGIVGIIDWIGQSDKKNQFQHISFFKCSTLTNALNLSAASCMSRDSNLLSLKVLTKSTRQGQATGSDFFIYTKTCSFNFFSFTNGLVKRNTMLGNVDVLVWLLSI